jgi:FkbM family methyltransferase
MPALPPLAFDRTAGRLTNATLAERAAVLALRAGAAASRAFSHHGYWVGCRLVAACLRTRRDIIVRLNADAHFAFPLADGYWSLLIDPHWLYEEEIEQFLLSAAGVDYTFVDCGANFGYWSVLVSSAPYGRHASLAIEASARNAALLKRNADLNGGRFTVLHAAIAAHSGHGFVHGARHEQLHVTATDATHDGEPVETVSLDDLLARGHLSPSQRSVVKLDVEGAEIDSLRGARELLSGDTIVICEEHGADRSHTVSRFILNETQCRLFVLDPARGRFERCTDLSVLDRIKTNRAKGYNVFATASAFWEDHILHAASVEAGRSVSAGMGAPALGSAPQPVR